MAIPHPPDQPRPEPCELIPAEQDLFAAPGVARVRIMGINALGVLHRRQGDLVSLLARGGALDVLLLDPRSAAFSRRRDSKETRSGRVTNRPPREMGVSMAILRNILNILLHEHRLDLDTLAQHYRVRLHDQTPTAARSGGRTIWAGCSALSSVTPTAEPSSSAAISIPTRRPGTW